MMWWLLKPDVQRTPKAPTNLDAPTKWVKVDVSTTSSNAPRKASRPPPPPRNGFLIREIKKPVKKPLRLPPLNLKELVKMKNQEQMGSGKKA
jgi:hypothetical protein